PCAAPATVLPRRPETPGLRRRQRGYAIIAALKKWIHLSSLEFRLDTQRGGCCRRVCRRSHRLAARRPGLGARRRLSWPRALAAAPCGQSGRIGRLAARPLGEARAAGKRSLGRGAGRALPFRALAPQTGT